MNDCKKSNLRPGWDILLCTIIILGISLMLYDALKVDFYFFGMSKVKITTFLCFAVLTSRIQFRVLKSINAPYRYICLLASCITLTSCIFFFNNLLHYYEFMSAYGWPDGITPLMFCRSDLTYCEGLGIFRYVLLLGMMIISYLLLNSDVCSVINRFIAKFAVIILEKSGLVNSIDIVSADDDIHRDVGA